MTWLEPIPDARVLPTATDPAELVASRETIRLAFVAALQHLPARQRAVLILCEVLRWKATEVAELLDTSVASVNSALQRARASLDERDLTVGDPIAPMDEQQAALLARYVEAFESYDMESLTALLHEDAIQSMPPYALWLQGRDDILRLVVRAGSRLPRVAPDPHRGQRAAGVRSVPAERAGRNPRAVGAAGAGDLRRPGGGIHRVSGNGNAVPAVRPAGSSAAGVSGRASRSPHSATSSSSCGEARCRRIRPPRLWAAS